MSIEILAAGVDAADSTEIIVIGGVSINVGLFRDDEELIEPLCGCRIFRKDPNGNLNPTRLILNYEIPNIVITGTGNYIVRRPGNLRHPTGIHID